jgi:RNA polymerase sigma-70 factor (ECF subfamily)
MTTLEKLIAEIYTKHLNHVYGFFYYKTFDAATTEDLTSSTFLIFVEKMRKHENIKDPEGFLYGIMKKVWLRWLQQKYKAQEKLFEDMDDFMTYVHEEIEEEQTSDDAKRVMNYIRKLPPAQRKIMELRLINQNTLKEICKITGKDMNYVKTTQKRGIKSLKQLLELSAISGKETAS